MLIVNCLDFIDPPAQVNSSNLSPNIPYYLPSLFHFLVAKASTTKGTDPSMSDNTPPKNGSGENDHNDSTYKCLSHKLEPADEGSLSITSNIHNLVKGLDDEENSHNSNAMEVDRNSVRIKKCGTHDNDIM